MDAEKVAQVRRFNRTVTQRIGALDDSFLSRTRPLAQARVLYEIGNGHTEVRGLRAWLDLDSGYLTRLLHALERNGLIAIDEDAADRRVRRVTLTDAGRAERAEYERLSDASAEELLEPLGSKQQQRLVEAMAVIEQLMQASAVEFAIVDPAEPAAREATRRYFAELSERFEHGYDPAAAISANDDEVRLPRGLTLLATLHGEPVALGLLKFHGDWAHLKRMWLSRELRGVGLGSRLLQTLESQAAGHGIRTVRLETNRALTEAIALYHHAGYREVARFNDEPHGDHWFEKELT
ncbi:MAG: MarR family transcriptional regulator [Schumannella sp.]|nr:MarR family transcriptional regulator [Schumannella sp.]